MKSPIISIIIVGMNHKKYLKDLLPSILQQVVSNNDKFAIEVIYVDNCSVDGSIDYVKNNYPEILIIKNTTPLGFGANNNKGVKIASGDYIAIINPDIVLKPNSLYELYRVASTKVEKAIYVPQLLNIDGSIQFSVRGFITLKVLWYRAISKGNDDVTNHVIDKYLCKKMDISQEQNVNWAIGAAMLMKRSYYNELKGFDEDYFLYMEDEDLCLRSWKKGNPVIYVPSAKMIHNHLRASSKIGKKMFMHIQSMLTFFLKHGINIKNYV